MKEQLINFETAKLAKDKGFKWKTRNGYDTKGKLSGFSGHSLMIGYNTNSKINLICNDTEEFEYPKSLCTASTQSLLQKWLREKHNIHVICNAESVHPKNLSYLYNIRRSTNIEKERISLIFKGTYGLTYEEALEKGLQEALKLI